MLERFCDFQIQPRRLKFPGCTIIKKTCSQREMQEMRYPWSAFKYTSKSKKKIRY